MRNPSRYFSRSLDIGTATKVATIIRTFGHAETEIWAGTEWRDFK